MLGVDLEALIADVAAGMREVAQEIGQGMALCPGTLANQVKTYIKHLGRESMYELFGGPNGPLIQIKAGDAA
jgi:hypothetical protein